MLERIKSGARYVFRHRTKTLGFIGMASGGLERWLDQHDKLPLFIMTHRGFLLGVFGALVTLVGAYNSVAAYFGWTDDP